MGRTVGLLSLPYGVNYGCLLQQWALYSFLKKEGFDVVVLNRRWNKKRNCIDIIKSCVYLKIICFQFTRFFNKMNHTNEIRSNKEMSFVIERGNFNAVIVGSDQVWRIENTRGVGLNFFLDFLHQRDVKKISYAASFGDDEWKGTLEETETVKQILKEYRGISVRELSGIHVCEKNFNLTPNVVLDPTLLLNASDYEELIETKNLCEDNVVTYFLDSSKEKLDVARYFSNNGKICHLYKRNNKFFNRYLSFSQWLQKIKNAGFVVVDSYHGMIFSIIFKKQFAVISNVNRGNSRFESLLKQLGLENRLIYDPLTFDLDSLKKQIDYTDVSARLDELRKISIDYLRASLG